MEHPAQWQHIQSTVQKKRLAHATLFVGPDYYDIPEFIIKLVQLIFCKENNRPCNACATCQMVHRMEHPDLQWIKPEKVGGMIKIDQIRELQQSTYLTPQKADYQVIVIEAADHMNTAASNALLKNLEEPAKHVLFFLIAENMSTILPTILSRCRITRFSSSTNNDHNNPLILLNYYSFESDRGQIIKQSQSILDGLIAIREGREHPCSLAAVWNQFELSALLWFLYLVYSQLQYLFLGQVSIKGPLADQLKHLGSLLNPLHVFKQIDIINSVLKKTNHNLNVNQTLVLEQLLFSLT